MKKFYKLFCEQYTQLIIITILMAGFISCEHDDDPNPTNPNITNNSPNDDNDSEDDQEDLSIYYVKYELTLSYSDGYFSSQDFNYEYLIDNGTRRKVTESIKKGKEYFWEATYGPLKNGTLVSLSCTTEWKHYPILLEGKGRIYVKENDGPFAIKAEGNIKLTYGYTPFSHTNLDLKYTIK
ncbi:MAG: hypothetical protein J1E37_00470 [Prevotella sp.]|nr:hypothetical protein [Prevotella sp.]